MRVVKKDTKKAKEESFAKIAKIKDDERREEFLAGLRNNEAFQRYVIEEIINVNLNRLTDIRNIKPKDFKDKEEVGELVFQAQAARALLEKILSQLIN